MLIPKLILHLVANYIELDLLFRRFVHLGLVEAWLVLVLLVANDARYPTGEHSFINLIF